MRSEMLIVDNQTTDRGHFQQVRGDISYIYMSCLHFCSDSEFIRIYGRLNDSLKFQEHFVP